MNSFLDDFKYAWNKPNNAVVQIIIINVVIFAFLNILNVILHFSQVPEMYATFRSFLALPSSFSVFLTRPWTLLTYMFVHEDIWHILGNMLFFYWFGRLIQEFLNSKRVIALYILGGLAGGVLYMLLYNLLPNFEGVVDSSRLIGASAGVFAVVVGAAVFMPNYTFYMLLLGPVKIKYIALVYVFLSFIRTIGTNAGGEFAHLGGAVVGWYFISQLRKGTDIGAWVISVMNWFKSFFVASPKIKVSHRSAPKAAAAPKQQAAKPSKSEQEEIDAILDKISHSGYDSLTKEEKQKLFNASKK